MQDRNKNKKPSPRSAARLAAVQALYQLRMNANATLELLLVEYVEHRLGEEIEGDQYVKGDPKLFKDIARGASQRSDVWDGLIEENMTKDWSISRLDPVLHSILRCGVYELSARIDVPTAVVINEYVDIAHAFFEGSEPAFVNGILDRIARSVRA